MIRKFRFDDGRDSFKGYSGWLPLWVPRSAEFDPVGGMGAAHDIMEHTRRDVGGLEAELRAFGAMTYIRVDNCWFDSLERAASAMRSDFVQFLNDELNDGGSLAAPPATKPLDDGTEEFLALTTRGLIDQYKREHSYLSYEPVLPTEQDVESIKGWMRIGYRNCAKRYRTTPQWMLLDCFKQIMEQVDRHHGDIGECLTVQVLPERCLVNVRQGYLLSEEY